MTNREKINQYELAIKEAEATLDNPSAPQTIQDAAEKVIASLSKKLLKLQAVIDMNTMPKINLYREYINNDDMPCHQENYENHSEYCTDDSGCNYGRTNDDSDCNCELGIIEECHVPDIDTHSKDCLGNAHCEYGYSDGPDDCIKECDCDYGYASTEESIAFYKRSIAKYRWILKNIHSTTSKKYKAKRTISFLEKKILNLQ